MSTCAGWPNGQKLASTCESVWQKYPRKVKWSHTTLLASQPFLYTALLHTPKNCTKHYWWFRVLYSGCRMSLQNEADARSPFVSSANGWTDTNKWRQWSRSPNKGDQNLPKKRLILFMNYVRQTNQIARVPACNQLKVLLVLTCGFRFVRRFYLKGKRKPLYYTRSISFTHEPGIFFTQDLQQHSFTQFII